MKRSVAEGNAYSLDVMRVLRTAATLLPLAVAPIGLLVRQGYLDRTFYLGDTWYVSLCIVFLGLATAQYFIIRQWPTRKNYLLIAIAYHIISVIFVLTITGFQSPIIVCWVALMLAVDTYFGITGLLLSMLTLVGTGVASLTISGWYTANISTTILYCLFITSVGFTVSRIRIITDKERFALIKSQRDENFQRERLLALVNSMGDAVIGTDEQGNIKIYNAAALNLLDTNVSLTNKKIDRILHLYSPNDARIRIIDQANTKHISFSRTDLTHKFNDGERMNLYLNVSPIQLSYQNAGDKGFIFILRDITKEKSLEEERDEFISVVSHELRTPVAIVEGNISNLRILQDRGAAKDVLNHALDDAHDQIMYLAKMVNDLSTLSRAERGLDSAVEEIDLSRLVSEIYHNYLDDAHLKGLALDLDVQPQLPHLTASRLYLEEILQNFMTNALKYTISGSVTLIAHNTKGGVYLGVRDTGIGISKSDQRHIFEKFYRSEDYRTRETNGTGLGLYVTHKLAAKMGVQIGFESRLNHGSTFSIVVPTKPQAKIKKP